MRIYCSFGDKDYFWDAFMSDIVASCNEDVFKVDNEISKIQNMGLLDLLTILAFKSQVLLVFIFALFMIPMQYLIPVLIEPSYQPDMLYGIVNFLLLTGLGLFIGKRRIIKQAREYRSVLAYNRILKEKILLDAQKIAPSAQESIFFKIVEKFGDKSSVDMIIEEFKLRSKEQNINLGDTFYSKMIQIKKELSR